MNNIRIALGIFICCSLSGMQKINESLIIPMPTRIELENRLKHNGFEWIIQKTSLLDQITGIKNVVAINTAIELAFYKCADGSSDKFIKLSRYKYKLLHSLFHDHPEVIAYFKNKNLVDEEPKI